MKLKNDATAQQQAEARLKETTAPVAFILQQQQAEALSQQQRQAEADLKLKNDAAAQLLQQQEAEAF